MSQCFSPVTFDHVRIAPGFWKQRLDMVRQVTVPVCLDKCEESHHIDNFRRAAGLQPGGHEGIYFDDCDVYKVLEGVAYVLKDTPDPALMARADDIIDIICAAQQPDGYLFTYYTLTDLQDRWTDMGMHEAFCLSQMIDGSIAYAQATGKNKWLEAARRMLAHMMDIIGPGKRHWITGHQGLEMALVRLYRYTGCREYLDYAVWLVDERGHGHLHAPSFDVQGFGPAYAQDDVPAAQLERVTGHAVRAMYYYSAMADIVTLTGDEALRAALMRLWHNVVPGNLYLTGGIGQQRENEGFTRDWHLPNLTAYNETCASIGMAMWNHRMNLMTGEAQYADLVELEMYNGILAGISLSGDRFFYENPLASVGVHHRQPWFHCSCCPTNLVRFLPSVGGYAYAAEEHTGIVNQYLPGLATIPLAKSSLVLEVDTQYPWQGDIDIRVKEAPESASLKLRIPGWCVDWSLLADGQPVLPENRAGYIGVPVRPGMALRLSLAMPVRREKADARVQEDAGRVAFARGPLVYCAEEADNPGIPTEYIHAELAATQAGGSVESCLDLLGGMQRIQAGGLTLIPYYAWDNRSPGGMAVWVKKS